MGDPLLAARSCRIQSSKTARSMPRSTMPGRLQRDQHAPDLLPRGVEVEDHAPRPGARLEGVMPGPGVAARSRQELRDAPDALAQLLHRPREGDAQVAGRAEALAGHDRHLLLLEQARGPGRGWSGRSRPRYGSTFGKT